MAKSAIARNQRCAGLQHTNLLAALETLGEVWIGDPVVAGDGNRATGLRKQLCERAACGWSLAPGSFDAVAKEPLPFFFETDDNVIVYLVM